MTACDRPRNYWLGNSARQQHRAAIWSHGSLAIAARAQLRETIIAKVTNKEVCWGHPKTEEIADHQQVAEYC